MIDYIVRIEQYQNKRFEFLTKNFQMYRCLVLNLTMLDKLAAHMNITIRPNIGVKNTSCKCLRELTVAFVACTAQKKKIPFNR